jgi:hypothetical protein
MVKRILLAAVIGVAVTLLLIALSFTADDAGHEALSNALFWQNSLLQSLVPAPHGEAAENPFANGLPLPFVVWFASVPFGFVIYGTAAFAIIERLKKKPPG